MVKEIDPKETKRAAAFDLWMKAPMPMVTLFKTIDVTNLIKISRKNGYKFNMLMCYSVLKAASKTKDFYLLPLGEKMMLYDNLAISVVVKTKNDISTCDIPFYNDIKRFNEEYLSLTDKVKSTGQMYDLGEEYMVIGSSSLAQYDIDGAVNIYAGFYNNPFIIWGRYRKKLFKTILPLSFQFHHTQMDGLEAAGFLEDLQREINTLKI